MMCKADLTIIPSNKLTCSCIAADGEGAKFQCAGSEGGKNVARRFRRRGGKFIVHAIFGFALPPAIYNDCSLNRISIKAGIAPDIALHFRDTQEMCFNHH